VVESPGEARAFVDLQTEARVSGDGTARVERERPARAETGADEHTEGGAGDRPGVQEVPSALGVVVLDARAERAGAGDDAGVGEACSAASIVRAEIQAAVVAGNRPAVGESDRALMALEAHKRAPAVATPDDAGVGERGRPAVVVDHQVQAVGGTD